MRYDYTIRYQVYVINSDELPIARFAPTKLRLLEHWLKLNGFSMKDWERRNNPIYNNSDYNEYLNSLEYKFHHKDDGFENFVNLYSKNTGIKIK